MIRKQQEKDHVNILFVGGDGRRKGLVNLLKAWNQLSGNLRKSAVLTVISSFRDGRVSPIPDDVRVLDSTIQREDVLLLMEAAHVFVLPTLYDSYGRVIVEAMAKGCCVISSRQDPQDWMLGFGEAGLLVDPESVEEIGLALEDAISKAQFRQQLAWQARQRFLRIFHHQVVGEQLCKALSFAVDH